MRPNTDWLDEEFRRTRGETVLVVIDRIGVTMTWGETTTGALVVIGTTGIGAAGEGTTDS